MQNLIGIVNRFRKHPACYEGNLDIAKLSLFIDGYETALLQHEIDEFGLNFNSNFRNFLLNKYNDAAQLNTWLDIIKSISDTPTDELPLFFSLFDQFIEESIGL